MQKFKIFWNFDAEEKYLNEMAKQGHIMKNYSFLGFYSFEKSTPQQLSYKIDYRIFKNKKEFNSYLTLFEDAGWRHVWGTKNSGSQYFLPINEQAGMEIFSDATSAAIRYKMLYTICMVNVAIFVSYLTVVFMSMDGNFSNLGFLTPGLWERTGAAFWSGFFFELPFVLLRVGFPIFFAVLACFYGYWGTMARKSYKKRI